MMEKANTFAQAWSCARCRLTVFSTGEEQQVEGLSGLGGFRASDLRTLSRPHSGADQALTLRKLMFAADVPLEGAGFELLVPRDGDDDSRPNFPRSIPSGERDSSNPSRFRQRNLADR
jgi:hypothetical protein